MHVTRVTNLVTKSHPQGSSRLRIIQLSGGAAEFSLPAVGVTLGADPACDVVLEDPAVSRRHVTIAPAPGGFAVVDLGSTNGTFVDGVAIKEVVVPVGTSLRLGSTLVELLPAEEFLEVPPSTASSFGALFGESMAMRRVYAVLERASQSEVPILLLGESGTGKELAARAVHEHSPRKDGPFVVFDCGAATESLVESELFGHKKGAFTGAHADHAGAFARAHGGTLFLDEIGDLPLSIQPKLLRLLERGEVTPVGGKKTERFDVRFVAATHRDLFAEVDQGTFRGDLYYRLSVVEVHMPPLRRRRDDIPALVERFVLANGRTAAQGTNGPALDRLVAYPWPGNVRELKNVVARACALAGPVASFAELPFSLRPAKQEEEQGLGRLDIPYHDAKAALLERFEREYVTGLVKRAGGNLSEAARVAGIERKYLYKLLEKHGLRASAGGD